MPGRRGTASASYFTDAKELIIKRFLQTFEAVSTHQTVMPTGTLLLIAPENDPDSGAVYFYDRTTRVFYGLDFTEGNCQINPAEFRALAEEYALFELGEQLVPKRLEALLFESLTSRPVTGNEVTRFLEVSARVPHNPPPLDEYDA